MHHPFADLSRLAVAEQDPGASLERALDIMRRLLGASDAYAVSGGDDGFDYTGSGEPLGLTPTALWLIHRDLTTRGRPCAFRVRSGRVVDFRPLDGRGSCDYVAALIPTQRATAAMLLARGVWRRGLSFGRREALETAMPALALALDRCFDRAHERREQTQLNSLVSIGRIISQADDLATTLTSIAVTVATAASVDYVSIDILGADGAVDIRCLNHDRQGTEQLQERWKRGRVRPDPVRDAVIATRQAMVFADAQNDERIPESGRAFFERTLIRSTGVFRSWRRATCWACYRLHRTGRWCSTRGSASCWRAWRSRSPRQSRACRCTRSCARARSGCDRASSASARWYRTRRT